MKVVLDTNIIASAVFFGGLPDKILDLCFDRKFDLILTNPIIEEYHSTCRKLSKKIKTLEWIPAIDRIVQLAIIVEHKDIPTPNCTDPDDIMFLQAAILSKSQYIVSGDRHLLEVKAYPGGAVLTARSFLATL